jgi:hypothetical protein
MIIGMIKGHPTKNRMTRRCDEGRKGQSSLNRGCCVELDFRTFA